jgi:hypothetical protein
MCSGTLRVGIVSSGITDLPDSDPGRHRHDAGHLSAFDGIDVRVHDMPGRVAFAARGQ